MVFNDHYAGVQLCLWALMPFISYFLQFIRTLFGRPEPDALISLIEGKQEQTSIQVSSNILDREPQWTQPVAQCPVLYTKWAKLSTAVYLLKPRLHHTLGQCFYTAIGTGCWVWPISSEKLTDVIFPCFELQIFHSNVVFWLHVACCMIHILQ